MSKRTADPAAAVLCLAVLGVFFVLSEQFLHWFVVPVLFCGVIIGADGIRWLRGRWDIMDVDGVIGVYGLYFFFLAPLLHVWLDYWMYHPDPPLDWRDWIGAMACVNLVGLILYVAITSHLRHNTKPLSSQWVLSPSRFNAALCIGLPLTGFAQVAVYVAFGGLAGYMATYEAREGGFAGMGVVFMFSESFPILVLMGYAVWTRNKGRFPNGAEIALVMAAFLLLKLACGGLRGSRSTTVFAMFWAAGIIHLWVRPLARRSIVGGIVALVLFMYLYGFYKAGGREGLATALAGTDERQELASKTGRTFEAVLLGDLERTDIQAFLLYRLYGVNRDFQYALGRTYLGALVLPIPKRIWPDRPLPTSTYGTQIQYGMNSFVPGEFKSSRVYGLAGEAILNFGPIGGIASFVALAIMVASVSRTKRQLCRTDPRLLLYPLVVTLCVTSISSDSGNIVFSIFHKGLVPFLVVTFASIRWPAKPRNRISNP